ncbi:hypothetical protein DE146DRAFT_641734 [Phaeosphaeria sp. MPI-PUGE-AT-0046c]|nr:hypothetical protein DE146DRAFT_641734 [Phaeosphaeria sp. MPI-PUGE-AT-0046c]
MMSDYVQDGLWIDHSTNTKYITVTEERASKITILLSLVVWLSLLRSYEIFRRFFQIVYQMKNRSSRTADEAIAMEDLTIREVLPAVVAQVLSEERSMEGVLPRIIRDYVLASPVRLPGTTTISQKRFSRWCCNALKKTLLIAAGLLFIGLAVGYQFIVTYTSLIIDHNTVRSKHPKAGAWYPDVLNSHHMANTSIFPVVNEFQTDLMFKAVAYADACYKEDARDAECSLFYKPRLNYTELHNASCPFEEHMCLGEPNNAFVLDTDWIDAKVLGINKQHTCQFRARKVCSPLNLEGYIRSRPTHGSDSVYVEYMLGDGWGIVQQGNKTFGDEVKEDALFNPSSPRQLIPEMRVQGGRVTVYFVRPVSVAYTRSSSDPVFPATLTTVTSMDRNFPLYYNPHQRSTAFACADSFTIRHSTHHHLEWQPRYQNLTSLEDAGWTSPDETTSLHILNITQLAPSYFLSRYADMSAHFDAPRRIGSFYSAQVDKEQWKLEARKIFVTELALLQYHSHEVTHGLGYNLPHAINILDKFGINASGIMLFPAPGWKNIKVSTLLGFLCACIACWVLDYISKYW